MNDYSQNGEQAVILNALRDKLDMGGVGRFLDIGAWDPEQFSNTRALVELGWSGVFIEPSPAPLLNLIKAYGSDPRYVVIGAAVGLESRLVKLHVSDDAVTTGSEVEYERWKDAAKFHGTMMAPAITPEQIFGQFGGFDFVNIDAEGVSADLFVHMLAMGVYPPCCCVEHDSRTTELMTAASALDYSAKVVGANLIVWR